MQKDIEDAESSIRRTTSQIEDYINESQKLNLDCVDLAAKREEVQKELADLEEEVGLKICYYLSNRNRLPIDAYSLR